MSDECNTLKEINRSPKIRFHCEMARAYLASASSALFIASTHIDFEKVETMKQPSEHWQWRLINPIARKKTIDRKLWKGNLRLHRRCCNISREQYLYRGIKAISDERCLACHSYVNARNKNFLNFHVVNKSLYPHTIFSDLKPLGAGYHLTPGF